MDWIAQHFTLCELKNQKDQNYHQTHKGRVYLKNPKR